MLLHNLSESNTSFPEAILKRGSFSHNLAPPVNSVNPQWHGSDSTLSMSPAQICAFRLRRGRDLFTGPSYGLPSAVVEDAEGEAFAYAILYVLSFGNKVTVTKGRFDAFPVVIAPHGRHQRLHAGPLFSMEVRLQFCDRIWCSKRYEESEVLGG